MSGLERAASIEDLRRLAARRLPRFVMSYLEGGSGDGATVRRNIDAFQAYTFNPRVLSGAAPVELASELFGQTYALPFGISAVGSCGVYRRHADEMLADVAKAANIPFILSGTANASIETIARRAPDQTWYQLYGAREPALTDEMVGRAAAAGVQVLVFTVDYQVAPRSEVSVRTGVSLALGPSRNAIPRLALDALRHPAWTAEFIRYGGAPKLAGWERYAPPKSSAAQIAGVFGARWLGGQTWRDVARIRKLWPGALVIKGVVHSDDAARAFEEGADAVTVSNHGGNRLDRMPATLDSLIAIRAAIGPGRRLFFDGGIRRGSDMVTAAALGADFSFTGRSTVYGVTAGGAAGAARAIAILREDLEYCLAMIGRPRMEDLGSDVFFTFREAV